MEYQCIPIKSSHYMALCLLEHKGNIILQPNPAWWAVTDNNNNKKYKDTLMSEWASRAIVMWFTIKNMF